MSNNNNTSTSTLTAETFSRVERESIRLFKGLITDEDRKDTRNMVDGSPVGAMAKRFKTEMREAMDLPKSRAGRREAILRAQRKLALLALYRLHFDAPGGISGALDLMAGITPPGEA